MAVHQNSPKNFALDCKPTKEKAEGAVLDLSCKKEQEQITSCNLSPVSIETRSVSPLSESNSEHPHYHHHHHHHHHQNNNNYGHDTQEQQHKAQEQQHHPYYYNFHHHSSDDGQKSPENRSYMVTPPSESDSPKKQRYQAISPQQSSPKAEIGRQYTPNSSPILSVNNLIQHPIAHSMMPVTNNILYSQELPPTSNLLIMNPKINEQTCTPDGSKKVPRPFKAYPKDPLSLTVGPSELIYDQTSKEAYNEFRKKMLDSVRKTNDGTNIKMRRLSKNSNLPTSTIDDNKDGAYWERRRKNNEAAKRSRDARRAKEDEIAIRAAYLEQENIKLKYEIIALRNETTRLRCMMYPS